MKKTLVTLTVAMISYCAYAQTNTFPSSGNVGIGTTSPTGQLSLNNQISNTSSSNNPINYTATSGVTGQAIFNSYYVVNTDGAGTYPRYLDIASVGPPDGTNGGGNIRFLTNPITTSSPAIERMRVNSNGNVGIGTTSPGAKLDVNGATNISKNLNVANTLAYGRSIISTSEAKSNSTPTAASTALFLSTNETDTPFGVKFQIVGNSIATSRYISIQTGEHNVANNGNLIMQSTGGNVGIGTTTPDTKLAVLGTIHANEVKVDLSVPGPDYVFEPNYKLPKLNELKDYLDKNHHLPEIPSAELMAKEGINLGDMNVKLLKKVEELTLYLIKKEEQVSDQDKQLADQKKQITAQGKKIEDQQQVNQSLQEQINALAKKLNK